MKKHKKRLKKPKRFKRHIGIDLQFKFAHKAVFCFSILP